MCIRDSGYTALFDTSADPEIYKSLPFEKDITHLAEPALDDAEPRLRVAGANY